MRGGQDGERLLPEPVTHLTLGLFFHMAREKVCDQGFIVRFTTASRCQERAVSFKSAGDCLEVGQ